MNIHLVSYDLRAPGRNYETLHQRLQSYNNWAKPLESVWLIETSLNAGQLRDDLVRYLDVNDQLFVVEVTKQPASWKNISAAVINWINSRW